MSVERKIPTSVAAKTFVPTAIKALMLETVRPESSAVHVAPASIERNIPPPSVPAKTADPTEASANTLWAVRPLSMTLHAVSPIEERTTPPP